MSYGRKVMKKKGLFWRVVFTAFVAGKVRWSQPWHLVAGNKKEKKRLRSHIPSEGRPP